MKGPALRLGSMLLGALAVAVSFVGHPLAQPNPASAPPRCPAEMVRVRDFCIDRYEMSTVDHRSGQALSPFYPPQPRLLETVVSLWTLERRHVGDFNARDVPLPELPEIQRTRRDYAPRAVSRAAVLPQAYLSYPLARLACENARKRLCTEAEWLTACRGERARKFPYGDQFDAEPCNVYRPVHPAQLLHGASWYGHRDPRLNLVTEFDGTPLLRLTGGSPRCASTWHGDQVFDMVGNLDEWVEAEKPLFVGGFYARSTREGCEARVGSHAPPYYDYSTGGRCCRSAL